MTKNTENITFRKELPIIIILGLILLNLFNLAIYWAYLSIPLFIILFRSNVHLLDNNFIIIFLFSLLYIVCLLFTGLSFEDLLISVSIFFGYFFFPAIFYFFGKYIVYRYQSDKTVYFFLFFICFLFSILPFLANAKSVIEQGFMQERNLRLFWMERGQVQAATGIGGYFALNMSLLPLIFTKKTTNLQKKLAIFSIFLFAIGIFSTLNMSNRTGLLITFISLVIFIYLSKDNLKSLFFSIFFIILILVLYFNDIWGFRFWFEHTAYFDRLANTSIYEEGSRYLIWKRNLIGLINNPYGNFKPHIGNDFAHNLWLDVGLRTGFIPLLPLLVFTISAMISVFKLVNNKQHDHFLRVLIVCFAISFYVTFFLEPILEGIFILFLIYCFYFGIVVGTLKFLKQ